MADFIEVTDQLGRVIRCSEKYWKDHILGKHPDLEGSEEFVRGALVSPLHGCIYASKTHETREIYYGTFRGRLEIKVVVDFGSPDEGLVVSATVSSRRPDGEKLKWSK